MSILGSCTVTGTPANVHEITQADALLHGQYRVDRHPVCAGQSVDGAPPISDHDSRGASVMGKGSWRSSFGASPLIFGAFSPRSYLRPPQSFTRRPRGDVRAAALAREISVQAQTRPAQRKCQKPVSRRPQRWTAIQNDGGQAAPSNGVHGPARNQGR